MTFERGMVSGESPERGPSTSSSPHETPRSNPHAVDRETGLSLRFIRQYDASKDVYVQSLEFDAWMLWALNRLMGDLADAWPVDPNAPRTI